MGEPQTKTLECSQANALRQLFPASVLSEAMANQLHTDQWPLVRPKGTARLQKVCQPEETKRPVGYKGLA